MDEYPAAFINEDTTGTQSVREAAEFFVKMGYDSSALWFLHNGKRYLVEINILCCEDDMDGPVSDKFSAALAYHFRRIKPPESAFPS